MPAQPESLILTEDVAEDKSLRIMPTMKTVQSAVLVLFLGSLGVTADRELDPFAGGGFFDDDAKGGGISKKWCFVACIG